MTNLAIQHAVLSAVALVALLAVLGWGAGK